MKIRSIFLLTLIAAVFPVLCYAQDAKPPLITFDDLKNFDSSHSTFRIIGYVFDTYKCPPCPPRMMCKPCIPDNITAVDKINEKDYSAMKRLRITTDDPEKVVRLGKYMFTVKVRGLIGEGKSVYDVDLISFEKLKQ